MDFQQSKTYANLLSAYEWEANVYGKYSLFADTARLEGFEEIGNVFDITARNEKEHARIWLRRLNNGQLPSTLDNLIYSTSLENFAGNDMYRQFANTAREEGYNDIAALFNGVANIELNHDLTFQGLSSDIQNNQVFCKEQESLWICLACGNIMSGLCAPQICPVCGFPQGFYKLYSSTSA